MNDFQLIVIGAGPGGYVAALRATKLGLQVAVVERRETGGTCLNRGCIPTKTLLHSSQVYQAIAIGEHAGITAQSVQVDMAAIFAHKRQVSQQLADGIESMFQKAGITLLRGAAAITAPNTVQVTGPDGEQTYTADDILIATGSVPVRPPIPGLELPGVMTSDELLEGSDHLYRSIVIIGGGVIGVEFATFYNDLGCEVTVLEGMNRLLPTLDRELGQNLRRAGQRRPHRPVCHQKGHRRCHRRKSALRHRPQGLLGRSLRRRLHPRERREAPPGGRSLPDLPPPRLRHW